MTRTPRVLVIDDDPAALQTTRAQLMPESYDVTLASSGVAALDHLAREPGDLVICDLMMPGLDGYEVSRAFKAHAEWRYVPIILLTALDSHDAIVRGLEAGADELVTKPTEGAVLRARARSMLRVRHTYKLLRAAAAGPDERRADLMARARLTDREREVLELLLLGRTHEDIADVLGISERTSKFHQANLLAKLGAESRLDLLRLFL
ncbi:MAG TPA: response regulator [Kofleriaceae bacterium]|nr:response regulator [Kofleriaceae bacterium]